MIVPLPGNPDVYYIFTADAAPYYNPPNEGVFYSILSKCVYDDCKFNYPIINRLLIPNNPEKLAAVNHYNGTDVGVVGHRFGTTKFYAFLSSDGEKMAMTTYGDLHGFIELFDFNSLCIDNSADLPFTVIFK